MQHISQETKEEDLPEGVLSISLLKHQVNFIFQNLSCCYWYVYSGYPVHCYVLVCLTENSISLDALQRE